jgi:gluconokinase
VGTALARLLGWEFVEGDDFHPRSNIEKMQHGIPLTDQDRQPWLQRLRRRLLALNRAGKSAVLTCSALKASYRTYLHEEVPGLRMVYLRGNQDTIRTRLQQRSGHFMPATLLPSQFATLEESGDGLTVDVERPLEAIVQEILDSISDDGGRRKD